MLCVYLPLWPGSLKPALNLDTVIMLLHTLDMDMVIMHMLDILMPMDTMLLVRGLLTLSLDMDMLLMDTQATMDMPTMVMLPTLMATI